MNPMPSCPLPGPESLGPLLNVSCEHGVWLPWARRICQAQAALSSVRYHLYPSPAASPRLQTTGAVWPSAHQRGSVWRGALPSWCRPSSELSGRISLLGCVAWILGIKDAPQIESSTFLKKLYFVLRYRQLTRRRQWHPTPVYLPGESQGRRSLVGCSSMGSWRVRHDWATSLSLFTFMHWRRKWQPTPVFLPGESQGWWSQVGCRLRGRTESDTAEVA